MGSGVEEVQNQYHILLKFIEFWEEIGVVSALFYVPLFTFLYLVDLSPYMIMLQFFKSPG